jgi:hypothetical protein
LTSFEECATEVSQLPPSTIAALARALMREHPDDSAAVRTMTAIARKHESVPATPSPATHATSSRESVRPSRTPQVPTRQPVHVTAISDDDDEDSESDLPDSPCAKVTREHERALSSRGTVPKTIASSSTAHAQPASPSSVAHQATTHSSAHSDVGAGAGAGAFTHATCRKRRAGGLSDHEAPPTKRRTSVATDRSAMLREMTEVFLANPDVLSQLIGLYNAHTLPAEPLRDTTTEFHSLAATATTAAIATSLTPTTAHITLPIVIASPLEESTSSISDKVRSLVTRFKRS